MPIFQCKILIFIARYYLIGLLAIGQIFQCNRRRSRQLFDSYPTAKLPLICCVPDRNRTIGITVAIGIRAIITAIIHQTPRAHSIIRSHTARIVKIGESQRMAIFMAKCTDSVPSSTTVSQQLGRTSISIEIFTVDRYSLLRTLINIPSMRPNRIFQRTVYIRRFSIPGINHIHQIDESIIISVIYREIDRRFRLLTSIDNHLIGTYVLTGIIISPIISHRIVESDRPYHIECRLKESSRLRNEIIPSATDGSHIIISFLIHHLVESLLCPHRTEFLIAELNQQDQTVHIVAGSSLRNSTSYIVL